MRNHHPIASIVHDATHPGDHRTGYHIILVPC